MRSFPKHSKLTPKGISIEVLSLAILPGGLFKLLFIKVEQAIPLLCINYIYMHGSSGGGKGG
jgi:hypothetical protein